MFFITSTGHDLAGLVPWHEKDPDCHDLIKEFEKKCAAKKTKNIKQEGPAAASTITKRRTVEKKKSKEDFVVDWTQKGSFVLQILQKSLCSLSI